jgi:hypothetical protein
MAYVNITSSPYAMFYQGTMLEITCILKEGNITYNSGTTLHNYKGKNLREQYVSFASPLAKGSLVGISADTANTSAATGGLPVVEDITTAVPFIGILLSDPENIQNMPAASQTTWSTMLSNKYYRIGNVGLFCQSIIPALTPAAGSTAITPGNSVIFDMSSDGVVYGRPGLSEADTAVYDASGADTGANGFLTEPIALHYSASNTAYIAVALGLRPVRCQT